MHRIAEFINRLDPSFDLLKQCVCNVWRIVMKLFLRQCGQFFMRIESFGVDTLYHFN